MLLQPEHAVAGVAEWSNAADCYNPFLFVDTKRKALTEKKNVNPLVAVIRYSKGCTGSNPVPRVFPMVPIGVFYSLFG